MKSSCNRRWRINFRCTSSKNPISWAQARQIQFEGVLSAAKHEFEYVFETFPRDLNSLMLLKSVSNDLPKTVEEAEKITLKKNLSLVAARISTDISKEAINTAKTSLFPKIKGIVSHSEKNDFGGIVGYKEKVLLKLIFHIH